MGQFLSQFSPGEIKQHKRPQDKKYFDLFLKEIDNSHIYTSWFTRDNVLLDICKWADILRGPYVKNWINKYCFTDVKPKNLALVMPSNTPLDGMYYLLSAIISNHNITIRLSPNNENLFKVILSFICDLDLSIAKRISVKKTIANFDAIITEEVNKSLHDYLRNKPSIIETQKKAVAVLTGSESVEDLKLLSDHVFDYFGLSNRNISKIFVPEGYDFDKFFRGVYCKKHVINHAKYYDNYQYNRFVYLMNKADIIENGFLILKEDIDIHSPISTLFYQYYKDLDDMDKLIKAKKDSIEYVLSNIKNRFNSMSFKQSHNPTISDYVKTVDVLEFLTHV
ncbi:hypothetical protein [Ichthyobacterium seriolicida]|uniref:hypothetical protein n=1 Tax=Ichthyobacterium seriolicida TaxID=242600 RepID=UPI0012FD7A5E|nr:hypothetical protein [Ichthyobacterium seriolicida]